MPEQYRYESLWGVYRTREGRGGVTFFLGVYVLFLLVDEEGFVQTPLSLPEADRRVGGDHTRFLRGVTLVAQAVIECRIRRYIFLCLRKVGRFG